MHDQLFKPWPNPRSQNASWALIWKGGTDTMTEEGVVKWMSIEEVGDK